jgi:hypothetical protein
MIRGKKIELEKSFKLVLLPQKSALRQLKMSLGKILKSGPS